MKLLRYETLTLWNYYVMKLLRYETLTLSDATFRDIYIVLSYVLQQYQAHIFF